MWYKRFKDKPPEIETDVIDWITHYAVETWMRLTIEGGRTVGPCCASHSALLRRLLSGKPPLDKPPPRACSYPWYELGEGAKCSLIDAPREYERGKLIVEQATYDIESRGPDGYVVVWPGSGERFRVWLEGERWFIQKEGA